jgi:hypothetical protein
LKYSKSRISWSGTQTQALAFGGGGPGTNAELYDGTSWIYNNFFMATGRAGLAGAGTQTAGLAIWWKLCSLNRRIQLNNFFPSHGCLGERREFIYSER